MPGRVIWLDEVESAHGPLVGAKAHALARLRRAGLPVPDGFVVVADGDDEVRAAYARLEGAVAVRSSSAAEDTADASFAGQYRTELDVQGVEAVLAAIARCRASAAAGGDYALALGAPSPGPMAVLVQRFVEPTAAGVVFTRHPFDPRSLLVESHPGRGEAVVSGRVTPARYVLDRDTGALRDPPGAGGIAPADLARVAALARRAEEVQGAPQDVEFAVGPDGPVVLQSRPITVESEPPRDPRLRRLTRANVGEVLPDPVTPLTWTTVAAFLEHAFQTVAEGIVLAPRDPAPFLVLHHERLYLNLDRCLQVASRLPGVTAPDAERLVLGGGAADATPRLRLSDGPRLLAVSLRMAALGARLPREVAHAEDLVARLPSATEVAGGDDDRLLAHLDALVPVGRSVATTHVAASGASAFRLALLGKLLGILAPGRAEERVNRLVTGLSGVASVVPTLALETLAEEVVRHPDWRAWLDSAPHDLDRAPPDLAARLKEHLRRFGHRALSEGELRTEVWADDPRPVLSALAVLASRGGAPDLRSATRGELRRAEEEALASRLGPLLRGLVRRVIGGAQEWVRRREHTKSLAVALVHHTRLVARAAARRLVARGALPQEDDVFFLTLEELRQSLRGHPVPVARLRRRRRRFERARALPAPRDVDLHAPLGDADDGPSWTGIGVSPGTGVGPARVAVPGEAVRLDPGDVLVAPVLDAALGPALAAAAGAVAEMGGLLSHGAVVARELGVPCVVDVRGATRSIRTGDRILVDGGRGRVCLVRAEDVLPKEDGLYEAAAPADEAFHPLLDHPLARESVYFNAQDPDAGVVLVASAGVRRRGRGEALLALQLGGGPKLFGLELASARLEGRSLGVAGVGVSWDPVALRFRGRLSEHDGTFPPSPLPLLLSPRTAEVSLDLTFTPTTPAVDFCAGLDEDSRRALEPLGAHHVEQSGTWQGHVTVHGRRLAFRGTGSRDHTWGRRDWEAADWWRLFTVRLGDDLAVHALVVGVSGRVVEGGFVWRDGRAERVDRVWFRTSREEARVMGLELEVTTVAGPTLRLRGAVVRTLTVPVQVERRPGRHLAGRPYRLLLHENFVRYQAGDKTGYGMAELTERPSEAASRD